VAVLVLMVEKEVLVVVDDGLIFVLLLLAVLLVPGIPILALVIAVIRWLNRH
jgi:F0F1-type ATP synthase membrane subunit c/vacuolar-type H+-ATPase subunit K